ncbi:MAG TPA: hypothetical protein VNK50_11885 [Calidithermus sp.]|nr:hypothetical protein [Calidithermus sp.]
MHETTVSAKAAPVKMVHFIAELLLDLPSRGKVVGVEAHQAGYVVTLAAPDGVVTTHHLSAWDVSRGLRGDPQALAAVRAGLLTGA